MQLIRSLLKKQHELGYLSDDTLRAMAREHKVPLYRLEGLVSFYTHFRRTPPKPTTIDVCRDVCCSHRIHASQLDELQNRDDVEVRMVSCLGRCDHAPAAMVNEEAVTKFNQDLNLNRPVAPTALTHPTFGHDEFADKYVAVQHLVDQGNLAATCVERITDSGLRGMGGAGFPTGKKWELVAQEQSEQKYVICNADESEPGTFKDREIIRNLPHMIIEGMLLAGLTIGADRGIVFIRHEYNLEREVLQKEIDNAYATGILGENAAGSGQRFDLEIFVSPGGYILGEETALLEALEDKRGEPRNKPPYPGQSGLWGKPTLINNVETLAMASAIVRFGADWWSKQGFGDFAGLKFICISGDVNAPGVYLVPMGTSFQKAIELAGGMKDGKKLKAFLPGGASSLFLKPEAVTTPIDFDAVQQAGSMLGTGAIMIFNEDRDLFEAAKSITRFFRNESCGKCVPCRLGTEKAVQALEEDGRNIDQDMLNELNQTLVETSICGLGQVALAPVKSLLERFPK